VANPATDPRFKFSGAAGRKVVWRTSRAASSGPPRRRLAQTSKSCDTPRPAAAGATTRQGSRSSGLLGRSTRFRALRPAPVHRTVRCSPVASRPARSGPITPGSASCYALTRGHRRSTGATGRAASRNANLGRLIGRDRPALRHSTAPPRPRSPGIRCAGRRRARDTGPDVRQRGVAPALAAYARAADPGTPEPPSPTAERRADEQAGADVGANVAGSGHVQGRPRGDPSSAWK